MTTALLFEVPYLGRNYMQTNYAQTWGGSSSNVWYTVLAKQENSILLEVKEGPFVSGEPKELAFWAPQDGTAELDSFFVKCHKFSQSNQSLF